MESSPAIAAARAIVHIILEAPPPDDKALVDALDRLIRAYPHTPDSFPADSDEEPPGHDYTVLNRTIAERFPRHGWYKIDDPARWLGEVEIGDAIDDLADIVIDMQEMIWRHEHLGLDDAHWFFRLMHFHWSAHASELSAYLRRGHSGFEDSVQGDA